MLDYFQLGSTPAVQNVPVCASYCNEWFEACRSDFTCVENWFDALNNAIANGSAAGINCSSPGAPACRTFEDIFTDGRGLCNRMWGDTFFYSEDEDNCTVMEFNSDMPNPNFELILGSGGEVIKTSISIAGFALLLNLITVV